MDRTAMSARKLGVLNAAAERWQAKAPEIARTDAFFLSDETLDIAIVAVAPTVLLGQGSLDAYGTVRLIPAQGKILVGHPVSIIQHPGGQAKHWAVEQNKLLLEPGDADLFLTYSTDTQEGSSGSPAFNFDWELVAVHHSGVPRRVNGNIMTTAYFIRRFNAMNAQAR